MSHGEGEIAALTAAMRQIGVVSRGGAKALAICYHHQLIFDGCGFDVVTACKGLRALSGKPTAQLFELLLSHYVFPGISAMRLDVATREIHHQFSDSRGGATPIQSSAVPSVVPVGC